MYLWPGWLQTLSRGQVNLKHPTGRLPKILGLREPARLLISAYIMVRSNCAWLFLATVQFSRKFVICTTCLIAGAVPPTRKTPTIKPFILDYFHCPTPREAFCACCHRQSAMNRLGINETITSEMFFLLWWNTFHRRMFVGVWSESLPVNAVRRYIYTPMRYWSRWQLRILHYPNPRIMFGFFCGQKLYFMTATCTNPVPRGYSSNDTLNP